MISLHGLTPNSGVHIVLGRPAVRANLPCLVHNLLQVLLRQSAYLDEELNAQSHVQVLHATNKFYSRFDNGVFGLGGHLYADGGGNGVHGGLDLIDVSQFVKKSRGRARTACTVASREKLLRIGLSGISGAAKGFGHCQVDLEVLAVYMSGKVSAKCSIFECNVQHTLSVRQQREPLLCRGSVLSRCLGSDGTVPQ